MTYAYHPNTSVMRATRSIEAIRTRSNDERRADWYAKYCMRGFHRGDGKPRIRVPVTVPAPRESSRAASAPVDASPSSRAAGLDDSGNPLPASPDACSRVQVGAGRQSPPPTPAVDDDAGWADYMRRAFAGEFEPF